MSILSKNLKFDPKKLIYQAKAKLKIWQLRFIAYIKRLLFPLYLFPLKLVTYSTYYLALFLIKLLIWPFKSYTNFFKTIFWGIIFTYFAFTEYRFLSLVERYGGYSKFFCSEWATSRNLKRSVVRVVGGYSEGSGFFVADNQVLTSFHVIADEPSPKVIFPDGSFDTPTHISANPDNDLALLTLPKKNSDKIFHLVSPQTLAINEPLLAAGYPLGTDLSGEVTINKGNFTAIRKTTGFFSDYVQTSINLVKGMSGGPLVDQCGDVIGINTLSLSGMSMFVSSDSIKLLWPYFTEEDITKIEVDPSLSPEAAVEAFYTYLKARRMEDGYNLLSQKYLEKTSLEEWTNRFRDVLDVQIYLTESVKGRPDTVKVKFSTKIWTGFEAFYHYYEGTWETVKEGDVYKMNRSNIKEVAEPGWEWFYED
jgi:hypothetical protein